MMTKYAWKKLVTHCLAEVITEEGQPEPYDAETDTFAPGPRDRTEPVKQDIPAQMLRQSLYRQIRKAEAARKIKPKSWEELDAMQPGDLQRYYNEIGLFDSSVHVPGIGWGGNPVKESKVNRFNRLVKESVIDVLKEGLSSDLGKMMDADAPTGEKYKKEVYSKLAKSGFQQQGSTPREYVEYYKSGFATVQVIVDVQGGKVSFERFYDNEMLVDNNLRKELPLPKTYSAHLADGIVQFALRLKKSIDKDEPVFGGIDDVSEAAGNPLILTPTGQADDWSRPVYTDQAGKIYVDINLGNGEPSIHSVTDEGEPDMPVRNYTIAAGQESSKPKALCPRCKNSKPELMAKTPEGKTTCTYCHWEENPGEPLPEGFDPQSQGPNPDCKENPYPEWNAHMRTLEEAADEDPLYVEYHSERQGEEPFMWQGQKWQYVNAKYPDGKIDVGVYAFGQDMVIAYNVFQRWLGQLKESGDNQPKKCKYCGKPVGEDQYPSNFCCNDCYRSWVHKPDVNETHGRYAQEAGAGEFDPRTFGLGNAMQEAKTYLRGLKKLAIK